MNASPLRAVLGRCGSKAALLSFYPPNERHDTHDHDDTHLSLVLCGQLDEHVTRRDSGCAGSLMLRVRPGGCRHDVTFGPHGALILMIPIEPHDLDRRIVDGKFYWRLPRRATSPQRIVRRFLHTAASDFDAATSELLACYDSMPLSARAPPKWLTAAREMLGEDPASIKISALADQAGVHRVYFARVFERFFGAPPSVFRRRSMFERAIQATLSESGRSLADIAMQFGFADQSHFIRNARDLLGVSPGRLRKLLR